MDAFRSMRTCSGICYMDDEAKGILPKIISIGIVGVSVLSSVLLFDRFRIYDLLIDGSSPSVYG